MIWRYSVSNCQIKWVIVSNFVAFLENLIFKLFGLDESDLSDTKTESSHQYKFFGKDQNVVPFLNKIKV